MSRAILCLCTTFCLVVCGCKTKQKTETNTDIKKEYRSAYMYSRLSGLVYNDSIKENLRGELSGQITFWSRPDSIGVQYKVADMIFEVENNSRVEGGSCLQKSDSSAIDLSVQDDLVDRSETVSLNLTDSKLFDAGLLSLIIGIGISLLIGCFFIKGRK